MDIVPNTALSVDFLQHFDPTGPWTILVIKPTETKGEKAHVRARTFTDLTHLHNYIEEYNGRWNVYFPPNRCVPDVTTTPTKQQMTHIRCIHIDLDLPKDAEHTQDLFDELLDRLHAFDIPPSVITFSGGGYQAFWIFPEDLPADEYADRIETINQNVLKQVGGDGSCWNVNRLMRVPGTVNVLNAIKRERGRTPGLATVVESTWQTWSIKEHAIPTATTQYENQTETVPPLEGGLDASPTGSVDGLPAKLKKAIKGGDPSPWGNDRSKMVWFITCSLVRMGWSDEAIYPILSSPDYGCSAHCRDQNNVERYVKKQINDARDAVAQDWVRNEKGQILTSSQTNFLRALENLGVRFGYNTFDQKSYVNGSGPSRVLIDEEVNYLRLRIEQDFGFLPNKELFFDVVKNRAWLNKYNPIQARLDKLEWDHKPRIGGPDSPSWLTTYGGAEDNEYVRAIGRIALIAAVRRVRRPGCKHDEILVLVSEKQGTNKSSALRLLAMKDEWFSDSMPLHADEKKVIEQIQGKWIIECQELAGIKQAQVEEVKSLLSRQIDHARMSYARLPVEYPRQCVFFGTTNTLTFLRDLENRRFWPVVIIEFDLDLMRNDIEQLWAEAAHYEGKQESIELPRHLWPVAAAVQAEHRVEEMWATVIGEHLDQYDHGRIMTEDLWRIIGKPLGMRAPSDNARLSDAMRELGYRREHMRFPGAKNLKYGYKKGNGHQVLYVTRDQMSGDIYVSETPDETRFETKEQADAPYSPAPEVRDEDIPF